MDMKNKFDDRMELLRGRIPEDIRDALIETTETLDLCLTAVQSVFGEQASPEHALAFCNIVTMRYLSIRQGDTPSQLRTDH